MTVPTNRSHYLVSLARELEVQSNRIRDLIGESHWLSDGHHKEYLLIDLLNRHLPSSTLATRGFVVGSELENQASKEQDILIIDTSVESPLFNQGGIAITFPTHVFASISVKSTMRKSTVVDSLKGLRTVLNLCDADKNSISVWYGAYFYSIDDAIEKRPTIVYDYIQEELASKSFRGDSPVPVNMLCSNDNLLFKVTHSYSSDDEHVESASVHGYQCNGLATALFVAEILDHIACRRVGRVSGLYDAAESERVSSMVPEKRILKAAS